MSSREPQRRNHHSAFGVGPKHFLWGGVGSTAIQTAQIESFDIFSTKWQEPLLLKGSPPGSLYGMAVTTDGDSAYSFGGCDATYSNSIYEINLRTLQCKEILPATSTSSPPGVAYSGLVFFNERLVVYGGYNAKGRTNDLHVFDLRKSECASKLHSYLVIMS